MKKPVVRMCTVCRTRKSKQDLLRIAYKKMDGITIDKTGKLEGRGAYICYDEECAKKLVKIKKLNKDFKTSIKEEVYTSICEELSRIRGSR